MFIFKFYPISYSNSRPVGFIISCDFPFVFPTFTVHPLERAFVSMEAKYTRNKRRPWTVYVHIVSFPIKFKRGVIGLGTMYSRGRTLPSVSVPYPTECILRILVSLCTIILRQVWFNIRYICQVVAYEFLTAMKTNNTVLWDMKACSVVEDNRRFGDKYSIHFTAEHVTERDWLYLNKVFSCSSIYFLFAWFGLIPRKLKL
jgi:hypothetical protein